MSAATILTLANGRGIDLLNPKLLPDDFGALAEHLAKEKRFNGATRDEEYSVAEHLCRGTDAMLRETEDHPHAVYFSLHDAHEATLKDDTTPKKRALAEFAQQSFGILAEHVVESFNLLTDRHDAAIHDAAGVDWPPSQRCITSVKRYDLIMFVTEWRDLMGDAIHPNWAPYSGIQPLPEKIQPWPWRVARDGLMRRWGHLLPSLSKRPIDNLAHNKIASESAGSST